VGGAATGALASSLMDGLSVWLREARRPRNEQSPSVIRHETVGRLLGNGNRSALDARKAESGTDRFGLRPRDRGAQPRLPLARGISAASRVVRWHGRASLGRADGAAGHSLTETHPARRPRTLMAEAVIVH
jgi:hypothetical protein